MLSITRAAIPVRRKPCAVMAVVAFAGVAALIEDYRKGFRAAPWQIEIGRQIQTGCCLENQYLDRVLGPLFSPDKCCPGRRRKEC